MKIILSSLAALVLAVVLAVFVVLNLSIQQLVDFESHGLEVENTTDARIWSGHIRLRALNYAQLGILNLSWHWCPGKNLLNWCSDLTADKIEARGELGYLLSGALQISDMQIEMDSLEPLGILPALMGSRLKAQITSMRIRDFNCPLRNASQLRADLVLLEPQFLGNALANIDVAIKQQDSDYVARAHSSELDGNFNLNAALVYHGSGEMKPPANLAPLMDRLAKPLGGGRYAWLLDGQIAC